MYQSRGVSEADSVIEWCGITMTQAIGAWEIFWGIGVCGVDTNTSKISPVAPMASLTCESLLNWASQFAKLQFG